MNECAIVVYMTLPFPAIETLGIAHVLHTFILFRTVNLVLNITLVNQISYILISGVSDQIPCCDTLYFMYLW